MASNCLFLIIDPIASISSVVSSIHVEAVFHIVSLLIFPTTS